MLLSNKCIVCEKSLRKDKYKQANLCSDHFKNSEQHYNNKSLFANLVKTDWEVLMIASPEVENDDQIYALAKAACIKELKTNPEKKNYLSSRLKKDQDIINLLSFNTKDENELEQITLDDQKTLVTTSTIEPTTLNTVVDIPNLTPTISISQTTQSKSSTTHTQHSLTPKSVIEYFNEGEKYENLGRLDLAYSSYQEALKIDPRNEKVFLKLISILEKIKDWKSLIRLFEKFAEYETNRENKSKYYFKIASIYNEHKLFIEALKNLHTSLNLHPQTFKNLKGANELYILAQNLEQQGKLFEAKEAYQKSRECDAQFIPNLIQYVQLLIKLKNPDGLEFTESILQDLLAKVKGDETAKVLYLYGITKFIAGNFNKSLEMFQISLMIDSENEETLAALALALKVELKPNIKPKHKFFQLMFVLLKQDGLTLKNMPDSIKDDLDFVSVAVQQNGLALQFASPRLRNMEDLVFDAVYQDFTFRSLTDFSSKALEFASNQIKNMPTKDVHPILQKVFLKKLEQDPILVSTVVKLKGELLANSSNLFKDDENIVTQAVTQNGLALEYASQRLKDNDHIVKLAVSSRKFAIRFASSRLRNHPGFAIDILSKNGELLQYFSNEIKENYKIVKVALAQNPNAIEYASEKVQKQIKFNQLIWVPILFLFIVSVYLLYSNQFENQNTELSTQKPLQPSGVVLFQNSNPQICTDQNLSLLFDLAQCQPFGKCDFFSIDHFFNLYEHAESKITFFYETNSNYVVSTQWQAKQEELLSNLTTMSSNYKNTVLFASTFLNPEHNLNFSDQKLDKLLNKIEKKFLDKNQKMSIQLTHKVIFPIQENVDFDHVKAKNISFLRNVDLNLFKENTQKNENTNDLNQFMLDSVSLFTYPCLNEICHYSISQKKLSCDDQNHWIAKMCTQYCQKQENPKTKIKDRSNPNSTFQKEVALNTKRQIIIEVQPTLTSSHPEETAINQRKLKIKEIIKSNSSIYQPCYEKQLKIDKSMSTIMVSVFLKITNQGKVLVAKIDQSNMNHQVLEQCLIAQIKQLKFPTSDDIEITEITYPFIFNKDDQPAVKIISNKEVKKPIPNQTKTLKVDDKKDENKKLLHFLRK